METLPLEPWSLLLKTEDRPCPCHKSAEPRVFICFSSVFRLVVVHFFHNRGGRFPNSDVQEQRWKSIWRSFRGLFSLACLAKSTGAGFLSFFSCRTRLCDMRQVLASSCLPFLAPSIFTSCARVTSWSLVCILTSHKSQVKQISYSVVVTWI